MIAPSCLCREYQSGCLIFNSLINELRSQFSWEEKPWKGWTLKIAMCQNSSLRMIKCFAHRKPASSAYKLPQSWYCGPFVFLTIKVVTVSFFNCCVHWWNIFESWEKILVATGDCLIEWFISWLRADWSTVPLPPSYFVCWGEPSYEGTRSLLGVNHLFLFTSNTHWSSFHFHQQIKYCLHLNISHLAPFLLAK